MFSRILLASRPDVDGELAAMPALALALKSKARLRVLEWESENSLSIRNVLTRWNLLPDGSEPSDISGLGLAIKKRQARGSYCVTSVAEEARSKECDLVVLSSLNTRSWLSRLESRWLGVRPVFRCHCLVTPPGTPGIVDPATGKWRVTRLLCCGSGSRATAASLSQLLDCCEPVIEHCEREECWTRARQLPADLVIFSPRQQLDLDFLEKTVPHAPCSLLLVPPR